MSNDDKRRRRDGSTAQLSVAALIARREAETQPIPRITDEETVRFKRPTTNLSGRELHITELLRREGRAGEEERGGGFSVPKLVAMASGGVVLAGTVAFTATNLLSSPDERPLAEVRYDNRPAARSTSTIGNDLAAAAAKQQVVPQAVETTETTTTQPTPPPAPKPRATQQPAPTTTTEQPPAEQPPAPAPAPTTTSSPTQTPPPPTTTTTPPPPSTDSTPPPATSSSAAPSSGTPTSETPVVGIGLNLGGILKPLGSFDFFAPAK